MLKYIFFGIISLFWVNFIFNYYIQTPRQQQLARTQARYNSLSHKLAQDPRVALVRELQRFCASDLQFFTEHDKQLQQLTFEERLDYLIPAIKKASVRSLLYLAKVSVLGANSTRAIRSGRSIEYETLIPAEIQIIYPEIHQWSYLYFTRLVQHLTTYENLILSSLDMTKTTIRASFLVYGLATSS